MRSSSKPAVGVIEAYPLISAAEDIAANVSAAFKQIAGTRISQFAASLKQAR